MSIHKHPLLNLISQQMPPSNEKMYLTMIFSLLDSLLCQDMAEKDESFVAINDIKHYVDGTLGKLSLQPARSLTKAEIDEISEKVFKVVEDLGGKRRK